MSVAGLLAGCTPAAETPGTLATPTASDSPDPTLAPPVAEPAKPPQWDDTGAGGATAAAIWFLSDEYRYVIETNDTTEWQRLSTDDCAFCSSVVSYTESLAADALHVRLDQTVSVRPTRVEELNPLAYAVLTQVGGFALDSFDADGVPRGNEQSAAGQVMVVLRREGNDWVLREGEYFEAGVVVPSVEDQP